MARYILTDPLAQIKGSQGGATFQRCGRVLAIRKRNVPVQKKTPKQTASCNRLESFASRWRQLTAPEKATWTTFTTDYPRVDSFGTTYFVKPQALRIGANITQFPSGSSAINSLVAAIAFTAITEATFILRPSVSAFDLVITADAVQVNCQANWFVAKPSATKVSFQRSDLSRLGIIDSGNLTSLTNWFNAYTALFPVALQIVDFYVPVSVDIVQKSSGQVIGTLNSYAHIEP